MKKMSAYIFLSSVIIIAIMFAMSGCKDSDGDNPTTPSVPDPFVSLQEEANYTKDFWGTLVENGFEANIPDAGDYRFVYTTNLGTFPLMFRASSPAAVIVNISSEHQIQKVVLQKGTIVQSAASRLQTVEVLRNATFRQDKAFGDLVLIDGGSSALPKPAPTVTPTPKPTPTPTPKPTRPAGAEIRIVAVGDSITYGVGSSNGEGYPPRLEARLWKAGKNATLINAGVPGENSPGTDARFASAIQGASIVLLLIGTNDMYRSGICYGGPCLTEVHIASMLDKALQAGVTPIVSTIMPFNGFDRDPLIRETNQKIQSVAAQRGVSVADNYSVFATNMNSSYADLLHPNDWGYELMADAWYKAIIGKL